MPLVPLVSMPMQAGEFLPAGIHLPQKQVAMSTQLAKDSMLCLSAIYVANSFAAKNHHQVVDNFLVLHCNCALHVCVYMYM